MMWEVRQTNFMGGYDTKFILPWKWLARAVSRMTSKSGCVGEGCTAGCTYVAKGESE